MIRNGKLGTYRHLTLPKDYDQIESDEYFLNVGQTRDLSGLQWFDAKHFKPQEVDYDFTNTKHNKIQCNIYSAGLNFRDVMLATGIYSFNE